MEGIMKKIILTILIVASLFLFAKNASAWTSYSYPHPQYEYHTSYSYPTSYSGNAYANNFQVYSYGSKYDARYRGGYFPTIYAPSRPYGYQSGAFNYGSAYDKTYHTQSMSWYYGKGQSDWFYDGGARQSQYYVYY
jgi:hypothetical protein